jgi:hypothetical protein
VAMANSILAGSDDGGDSSRGSDYLPLADYDSLNVRQVGERLDEL